jgi:FkbM family methyltransferase
MRALFQKNLRRFGVQIKKYPDPDRDMKRRLKIINYCNIDTLFDIGANTGQYAINLRENGYCKKIISFEPVKEAFEKLKKASAKDKNWIINNYALGDANFQGTINVSGNSLSSSILNMLPLHLNAAPESRYIKQEKIEIRKLDSIFYSFCSKEDTVMLKIDTQGYEKSILDGATNSLNNVSIIQLEMSIVPLYENEMLYDSMVSYLADRGFQLFSLETVFSDLAKGRLLQVDGTFVNLNKIKQNEKIDKQENY